VLVTGENCSPTARKERHGYSHSHLSETGLATNHEWIYRGKGCLHVLVDAGNPVKAEGACRLQSSQD
jgi:hypothetical protein